MKQLYLTAVEIESWKAGMDDSQRSHRRPVTVGSKKSEESMKILSNSASVEAAVEYMEDFDCLVVVGGGVNSGLVDRRSSTRSGYEAFAYSQASMTEIEPNENRCRTSQLSHPVDVCIEDPPRRKHICNPKWECSCLRQVSPFMMQYLQTS